MGFPFPWTSLVCYIDRHLWQCISAKLPEILYSDIQTTFILLFTLNMCQDSSHGQGQFVLMASGNLSKIVAVFGSILKVYLVASVLVGDS